MWLPLQHTKKHVFTKKAVAIDLICPQEELICGILWQHSQWYYLRNIWLQLSKSNASNPSKTFHVHQIETGLKEAYRYQSKKRTPNGYLKLTVSFVKNVLKPSLSLKRMRRAVALSIIR